MIGDTPDYVITANRHAVAIITAIRCGDMNGLAVVLANIPADERIEVMACLAGGVVALLRDLDVAYPPRAEGTIPIGDKWLSEWGANVVRVEHGQPPRSQ